MSERQELEKLTNVPSTFKIADKDYTVRQLSILQIAQIRQTIVDAMKTEYKKDIVDVIGALPAEERSAYLQSALKGFKVTDDDINEKLISNEGIVAVLKVVLKESVEKIVELLTSEYQDELWEVYQFAMNLDNTEAESGNGEQPKN